MCLFDDLVLLDLAIQVVAGLFFSERWRHGGVKYYRCFFEKMGCKIYLYLIFLDTYYIFKKIKMNSNSKCRDYTSALTHLRKLVSRSL